MGLSQQHLSAAGGRSPQDIARSVGAKLLIGRPLPGGYDGRRHGTVWLVGLITGMCLIVPLLVSAAMGVIGLIEGIIYLTKSDEDFFQIYAIQKKEWF